MVVCRNINSNDSYLYLSGNRWRNLRTGVEQVKGQVANQNLSFAESQKMARRDKDSADKFALADKKNSL